jgi:hypothetical protein
VIAHVVAAPVLERLGGRPLRVVDGGREVAYVELDGWVVAVTGPGVPLMPNGVALTGRPVAGTVAVDGAQVWDPALRPAGDVRAAGEEIAEALRTAGDAVAGALGSGDTELGRAVATRDAALAARAGARLVGRGGGRTPEGDDMVAATAAVVAAGPWPEEIRLPWLGALIGTDLRRRTTALSATLLELAAAGQAIEPLHALLDRRPGALGRLLRLGHSTGRAYATAVAVAAQRL